MKKIVKVAILVSLLLSIIGCSSQEATIKVEWPLYKVEKNGNEMYIMGTIHIGKKEMYDFSPEVLKALKASKYLVTEADMEKIMSGGNNDVIAKAANLNEGESLNDLLSSSAEKELKEKSKEYGVDYNSLLSYKPWYISTLFANKAILNTTYEPQYGADYQLVQQGRKLKMQNKFLEEAAYTYEMYEKAVPNDQANEIIQMIPTKKEAEQNITKMVDAYIKGELKNLDTKMSKGEQLYVVEGRNNNWFPKLESYFEEEDTHFVAVGAGHLDGEKGLLNMFKNRGYKISEL